MRRRRRPAVFVLATVVAVVIACRSSAHMAYAASARDAYEVLLHSTSIVEQRAALGTIAATPRPFLPRLRQSLRDYSRLLVSDRQAASRAVTLAAYLRDTVFVRLLVESLNNGDGGDDCASACPAVLALTVHAAFGDWVPPLDLNPGIPAIREFRLVVERIPHLNLAAVPVRTLLKVTDAGADVAAVEGRSERQLIELAGPRTESAALRRLAAVALEASVATSAHRRDLYLLAMNDVPGDETHAYLTAIHEAIYRAEFARAHGR